MLKLPDSLSLALTAAILVAALPGCAGAAGSGPDMTPIGAGLKFIGIGLVVMGLVLALGANRKGGDSNG